MEPPPSEDWRARLTRLLNHPQFHQSTNAQKHEVLEEALRQSKLSQADFNAFLIQSWRTSNPIPQLNQSQLVYLPPKRPYISPHETFVYLHSEEESQDRQLLEEVEKFIWEEFNYDAEKVLRPLKDLLREIQVTVNQWLEVPKLRRIEHLETIDSWKRRFDFSAAVVRRNRECRNRDDPWDETPIIDISESEYLHLSNGMCWHIQSFTEYVRGINGVNDSRGLVGYTSERLWETEDLERIFNHPLVKAAGFDVWLRQILSASSYQQVSLETLDQLYRLASILVSRGNPFHRELQKELTPMQYKTYWQYTKGNSDELFKIPPFEGQEVIKETIKNKLKLDGFEKFMDYYNRLSLEERNALELLYPGFERDLSFCDAGRLCVYVLAKTAYSIYVRLAGMKGIQALPLDVSER